MTGRAVTRFGRRNALLLAVAVAGVGLPLLAVSILSMVLAGLDLVSVGTLLAIAIAIGAVELAAQSDWARARSLYLSAYYLGGLVGTAMLGSIFDAYGRRITVIFIAVASSLLPDLPRGCGSTIREPQ